MQSQDNLFILKNYAFFSYLATFCDFDPVEKLLLDQWKQQVS